MSTPTFALPPCPQCSNVVLSDLPYWRWAHNTSRARGHGCYIFTGCTHAKDLGKLRVYDESAKWSELETAWSNRCAELLAIKSARWKENERAHFKRTIEHKHFIPGAVAELDFKTDDPQTKHIAYVTDAERPF